MKENQLRFERLKSDHLPDASGLPADVPARFPDYHIHKLISRNPGLPA